MVVFQYQTNKHIQFGRWDSQGAEGVRKVKCSMAASGSFPDKMFGVTFAIWLFLIWAGLTSTMFGDRPHSCRVQAAGARVEGFQCCRLHRPGAHGGKPSVRPGFPDLLFPPPFP